MLAALEREYRAEVTRMEHSSVKFEYTERDLLIRLSEQVKSLTDEMRRVTSGIAQDVRDHEGRLRVLENFRWYLVGAGVAGGGLGGLVVALILRALK